jgi:hypothetical protein
MVKNYQIHRTWWDHGSMFTIEAVGNQNHHIKTARGILVLELWLIWQLNFCYVGGTWLLSTSNDHSTRGYMTGCPLEMKRQKFLPTIQAYRQKNSIALTVARNKEQSNLGDQALYPCHPQCWTTTAWSPSHSRTGAWTAPTAPDASPWSPHNLWQSRHEKFTPIRIQIHGYFHKLAQTIVATAVKRYLLAKRRSCWDRRLRRSSDLEICIVYFSICSSHTSSVIRLAQHFFLGH